MCSLLKAVHLLFVTVFMVQGQTICDIANCIHGDCVQDSQQRDGFRCDCNLGYTGSFCERLCTFRDIGCTVVTQPPICMPEMCMNGECSNSSSNTGSQCICYEGWTGPDCDIDIDYCSIDGGSLSFFGPCDDLGSLHCIDGNDTYSCECLIGFTGKNCESNINECDLVSNPCSGHGTCIDEFFASYSCNCDSGFTGVTCETTIPDCNSSPCFNQGTCQNLPGGRFRCSCPSGFNGTLCEVNEFIQTCASLPCQNNATCQDIPGSNFTCLCREGFFGSTCSFQNCTADFCKNDGKCVLNDSVPVCECSSRFEGNLCQTDRCENTTCLNGGTCTINNDTLQPSCLCRSTFTGASCETDSCNIFTCPDGRPCFSLRNECTCSNNSPCTPGNQSTSNHTCSSRSPCLNGGTCLDDVDGNFTCLCAEGYYGDTCSSKNCTSTYCDNSGTCLESDDSLYCECAPQYHGIRCEMDRCEDIICFNGGFCNLSELTGETFCQCNENFSGKYCELDSCNNFICSSGTNCRSNNRTCACADGDVCVMNSSRECTMETCLNGGSCSMSNGSLLCQCEINYGGEFCQDQLCADDSCPKDCSCLEVDGDLGKIPVCQCAITTMSLRIPPGSLSPILLTFVILLAFVVVAFFVMGVLFIIFICGRRKFRRKQKEGNNLTIHAEYHSNAVHLCEDNISVDVDQHHRANENIRSPDTDDDDDDAEILTNPVELELKQMDWNEQENSQGHLVNVSESDMANSQNHTVLHSTEATNSSTTPTSDFFEDADINSINLGYLDSDQERSDIGSSGVFNGANSSYRQTDLHPSNSNLIGESLSPDKNDLGALNSQTENESIHVNFSFDIGSNFRSHNSSSMDLEQSCLPEVIPNHQAVYDTTAQS